MSEVSSRLWFEERLWEALSRRAVAERTTVRELVPRLIGAALSGQPRVATAAPSPPPVQAPLPASLAAPAGGEAASGPPVVPMAETYICGVCGAGIRLGGLSQHTNRHLKEHQAAQAQRS